MLPERVTLDPSTENPLLAPLDLMGTDRSWGIYVMTHDYTPPAVVTQTAGSADTDGDPVVQNRYGNRTIAVRVRIFEPTDPAATNQVTNPSAEFDLTSYSTAGFFFLNPGAVLTRDTTVLPPPQVGGQGVVKVVNPGASLNEGFRVPLNVENGKPVTVSAWVRGAVGGEKVQICAGNGVGGFAISGVVTLTTEWQRIQTTLSSNNTEAVAFGLILIEKKAQTFYVDGLQAESTNFTGKVARTNLVPNPSFEVDMSGWVSTGTFRSAAGATLTRDLTQHQFGTASMKVVCPGTNTLEGGDTGSTIPVVAGHTYQVTAFVRGNAGGENLGLFIGDGAVGNTFKTFVASNPAFTRIEATFTATATGNTGIAVVTNGKAAVTFFVDGLMFEETAVVGAAYFPTPAQVEAGEAMWTGAHDKSASVFLTNANSVATAYFDGNTPGCDWTAALNGSASTRPAPDGTRFSRIYRDVMGKLDRVNRTKAGTLRRVAPGFQPITFDLRSAEVTDAPQDIALGMKRAEIGVAFTADPGGRVAELQVGGTREETTLPCLVFLAEEIPGDLEALGRMLVEDKQGVNQLALWWGEQFDNYVAGADTALFYEAESRTLKGTSELSAQAGASGAGNNTVKAPGLVGTYQDIFTTQASGAGNHLAHFGSFRVLARCWRSSANDGEVSIRLAYSVGDFTHVQENDPVVYAPGDRQGVWTIVDLGIVDIEKAPAGSTQRWEGRVQAKSTGSPPESLNVDCLLLIPTTEGAGQAQGAGVSPLPSSLSAYDPFLLSAEAALAGQSAAIGGLWGGTGDAVDFAAKPALGWAQRTEVSDAAGVGRYDWISETKYLNVVVKSALSWPTNLNAGISTQFLGHFCRYVDANNWLMAVAFPSLSYGKEAGSYWSVGVYKKVAGVKTLIGSAGLFSKTGWGVPKVATIQLAAIGTFWQLSINGVAYASGVDAVLGTTLKEGRIGIYDEYQSAVAGNTRIVDTIEAWEPTLDEAIYASRALELRSDRIRRQDSAGLTWGGVGYEGDYLRLRPSGPEKAPTRFIVKASRDPNADEGIDDVAAKLFVQPRYLVAPPS